MRRALLVVFLLLIAGAVGGGFWLQRHVLIRVEAAAMALGERLGMQASIGGVSLDAGGTVIVRDLRLVDGDGTSMEVARMRLVVELPRSFRLPGVDAIRSIQLTGVVWRHPGEPDMPEVIRKIRRLVRRLRRPGSTMTASAAATPADLPEVVIRNAAIVTDTRTLLSGRAEGRPENDGYAWNAVGALDTGMGASVGFRAHGSAAPSARGAGLPGRVRVTLDRPLLVQGPHGTRIAGVHRLDWDGETARTGPATVTDASGRLRLEVDAVVLTLGADGMPEAGRFDGATIRVAGRSVRVSDLRLDLRRKLAVLEGVVIRDAMRTIQAARVTVNLNTGAIDARDVRAVIRGGRRLQALSEAIEPWTRTKRIPIEEVRISIARVSTTGALGRIPEHVEAAGVTVSRGDIRALARRLTADHRADGGWIVSGRGELVPRGHRISVRGSVTLDAELTPVESVLELDGIPLAWDPLGWAEHISVSDEARANVRLEAAFSDNTVRMQGTLRVRDLSLQHWRLSPARIDLGPIAATFRLDVDRAAEVVELTLEDVSIGEARGALALTVTRFETRSYIRARVRMPRQSCQKLVEVVPPAARPNLTALQLRGETHLDVSLEVDLRDTRTLQLEMDGDIAGCRIVTMGKSMDRKVRRLKRRFVHRPMVATELVGVTVGPGTAGYVPIEQIPDWLQAAAVATEDRAFYAHDGLRLKLVRGALKLNLRHGRYVYGGSTITQQLVKNLFLTRRKDLMRKLEEAVIVTAVERKLTKNRIMELYLNCIEYGPKIWGLSAAAQAYYGKKVSEMTHVEGIYLMAIKPYPRHGWWNAKRNRWRPNWARRMRLIFHRIHRKGGIDDAVLEGAAPLFRPVFKLARHVRRLPVSASERID